MEQRIIKFKAKRLDCKGWAIGDLLHSYENGAIIVPIEGGGAFSVDHSTVCQFTGLKDTNDVPIFEGDIIAFDGEGEVVFKDGAFYAKFGKYTECLLCNLVKSGLSVTIVGNKFDKEK